MHETIFNQIQVLKGTIFVIYSYCKYMCITNYMYDKFYEVWTIIFKVSAISGYSGVFFRLKY